MEMKKYIKMKTGMSLFLLGQMTERNFISENIYE